MAPDNRVKRLIARLDVKGENLIKGIHMEGLRIIGDPQEYATRYYEEGADEIVYIDLVASLYGRSNLKEIVARACEDVFIPLTVGGGIRSIDDASALLRAGADKLAINTAAVNNPNLLRELSGEFGAQCVVLSIEARHRSAENWEVLTECGRQVTGLDVREWLDIAQTQGIGEILVTAVDRDGGKAGFDEALIECVCAHSSVPVIASGGFGSLQDGRAAFEKGADAIAIGAVLHASEMSISQIKTNLIRHQYEMRNVI
jgi:cyclase